MAMTKSIVGLCTPIRQPFLGPADTVRRSTTTARPFMTVFLYSIGMVWAEALHPDVWRADRLAAPPTPCAATGWAALDTVLPGGGWPLGALVELAVDAHALPWRVLQPALHAAARQGLLVLVGLPLEPQLAVWAAHGVDPTQVVRVHTDDDAHAAWAAEQALGCPAVSLCWLHWVRPSVAALRRLQSAASRAQRDTTLPGAWPAPLVLYSVPTQAAPAASPAVLRLHADAGNTQGLRVTVRKRRGPPLPEPVWIDAPLPWAGWVPATESPTRRSRPEGDASRTPLAPPTPWPRVERTTAHVHPLPRRALGRLPAQPGPR